MPESTLIMDHYYQFRSELKNLYKHDINANGDLACKVLEIRDKNRCVNSIEVSIEEGRIVIEFDPKTTDKKRKTITENITESINNFTIFIIPMISTILIFIILITFKNLINKS